MMSKAWAQAFHEMSLGSSLKRAELSEPRTELELEYEVTAGLQDLEVRAWLSSARINS